MVSELVETVAEPLLVPVQKHPYDYQNDPQDHQNHHQDHLKQPVGCCFFVFLTFLGFLTGFEVPGVDGGKREAVIFGVHTTSSEFDQRKPKSKEPKQPITSLLSVFFISLHIGCYGFYITVFRQWFQGQ